MSLYVFGDSFSTPGFCVEPIKECVLFDDTYYSVNAEDKIQSVDREPGNYMGHHGAKGNANWYNKVIRPKMEELGWL